MVVLEKGSVCAARRPQSLLNRGAADDALRSFAPEEPGEEGLVTASIDFTPPAGSRGDPLAETPCFRLDAAFLVSVTLDDLFKTALDSRGKLAPQPVD